ncbi:MAG TPA: hypothetical protein VGF39_13235 [Stellaceae bacterium]
MKLTLILDPAPVGVRASLVEEWDEVARGTKMEPRVRLFDTEEQALAWGRLLAHHRGLKQLFLTDNRKAADANTSPTYQ